MNAAVMETQGVAVAPGMSSARGWTRCDDTFSMKVLSVDAARHCVEVLFRIKAGSRTGPHKHLCETHVFVLEGRVRNHAIACSFGPGDYCFQPDGDVHDEEFVEDTVAYVSYRGHDDTLVEFYGEDGAVCGTFSVSDFEAGLQS